MRKTTTQNTALMPYVAPLLTGMGTSDDTHTNYMNCTPETEPLLGWLKAK
jgi:hypothetical protein